MNLNDPDLIGSFELSVQNGTICLGLALECTLFSVYQARGWLFWAGALSRSKVYSFILASILLPVEVLLNSFGHNGVFLLFNLTVKSVGGGVDALLRLSISIINFCH